MAVHGHFQKVVLESDCQVVIHKLQAAHEIQDEVGVICRNVKRLLQGTGECRWHHICREANEAAHVMAHAMSSWNETMIWFDSPPGFLFNQLQLDDVTALTD
ncbi:unnamed protein product [Linum tenue]|uniref:RNase H type-1 domain-containing protein n=1 Tax=Linum tenue TaxID=586396 RepID=A0AAV0HWP3_9ROSI|nr:unnamed protein product [Linum tenue]